MTVRLEGGCSIQLSYGCFLVAGQGLAPPAAEVKTDGGKEESALESRKAPESGLNPAMYESGPPPHPQAVQDADHLKLLSIFHYVLAGITALMGCFPIIHIAMGAWMVSGRFPAGSPSSPPPPVEVGWLFIIIGSAITLLAWAFAACLVMAGRSISARRNWTFCFVVACIACINMPLGTALGVFTLLVLLRPSVKLLFGQPAPGGYLNR